MRPVPMSIIDRLKSASRRYWFVNLLQFACVIGILIAGMTAYSLTQRMRVISLEIEQTLEFKNHVHVLLGLLQKAEASHRGFLLSRDLKYLKPYDEAISEIGPQLEIVSKTATASDRLRLIPDQQERLVRIVDNSRKKLGELAASVAMARRGDFDGAMRLLSSDVGERYMATVRELAERFQLEKNLSLGSQQAAERIASSRLFTTILLALLMVVLFGAVAVLINVRNISSIRENEAALQEANARLEARVHERTAELEDSNSALATEKDRTEALLKDLNHRVGNSLQLVSAFLGMQESNTGSAEARASLAAARSRVMAIASTQRRLRLGTDNETCDVNELLSDLVEDLKATVPMGNGMNMTYRGDPITMSARDAVSIGVIVGELVTNCLKYAFPDNGVGAIEVSLTREDEETARLEVADDGIGALAETPLSGLGSMIIATLSESIGGIIERSVANGDGGLSGMRVAVTFPVAPSAAEPT